MKSLKIGLLGLGTVGGGVYSLIKRKKSLIEARSGIRLDLVRMADRNQSFPFPIDRKIFTRQAEPVLKDPRVEVVVELIGGLHPALEFVLTALKNGKDVVTANKALLAEYGDQIYRTAEKYGQHVFFEASVGGGIPVIQALREGLVANQVQSIYSIINGTSNYILSEMSERHVDFSAALKDAQKKGYAEANPKLDVEGIDAAHKLTVLASLAFGKMISFKDVYAEGITQIRSEDIQFADEFGYCVKLLAIAKKMSGGVEARVQPTLVPKTHPLANVNGAFNAVLIRSDETGDLLFYGRGAGSEPTASAVVSDLVALAKARELPRNFSAPKFPKGKLQVKKISTILSRYYLRFHVVDRPGVLAKITQILGKYKISISDVIQKEWRVGKVVPLILLTHFAHEESVRKALLAIDRLSVINGKSQVLRIEA